jgi:hypothetical protein
MGELRNVRGSTLAQSEDATDDCRRRPLCMPGLLWRPGQAPGAADAPGHGASNLATNLWGERLLQARSSSLLRQTQSGGLGRQDMPPNFKAICLFSPAPRLPAKTQEKLGQPVVMS